MTYKSYYGFIPGYDAIWNWSSRTKAYNDWQRNVGSKGRRIAYVHRRQDFGSTRSAMQEIRHDVADMLSDSALPFE